MSGNRKLTYFIYFFINIMNSCLHILANMKIWRAPLPLNGKYAPLRNFWHDNLVKVIDTVHINNHQVHFIP